MGSICPCLGPAEDLDEEQKREIAIGKDIDNRKSELMYLSMYYIKNLNSQEWSWYKQGVSLRYDLNVNGYEA